MGIYTHFGSKQGLLEQLYLRGFELLEERLNRVPSEGQGKSELEALAKAYRAFALENEALYGLMFERAAPDFVPSDSSRLAGLATFEKLTSRVADWRPDFANPAADAHLIWATMHGLVTIELMHRRWGAPDRRPPARRSRAELTRAPSALSSKRFTAARQAPAAAPAGDALTGRGDVLRHDSLLCGYAGSTQSSGQ